MNDQLTESKFYLLKNFFEYMLGNENYLCCEKAYMPAELKSIALRFKRFDMNSTDCIGEKRIHFLNKEYLKDDVTFFMDNEIINFDERKCEKKPDIEFYVNLMRKDRGAHHFNWHLCCMPFDDVHPSNISSFGKVLDMLEKYKFDEVCYAIHNRFPLFI